MTRALVAVALAVAVVGCGQPDLIRDRQAAEAALADIPDRADKAIGHIDKAKTGARESAAEVRDAASDASTIPQARPIAERLATSADRLDREVVPELDEALADVEAVKTGAVDAAGLADAIANLEAERDQWKAEAAEQRERADSAIRKWLLIVAAAGFAGILAGGALFVWVGRKVGLAVGLGSLALFAAAVALHRWYEWIAWGGLAVILLAVAGLAYGLWRYRDAFRAVVEGGQHFKEYLQDGVTYTREQIRDIFRRMQRATQYHARSDAEKMVRDVKKEVKTGCPALSSLPLPPS